MKKLKRTESVKRMDFIIIRGSLVATGTPHHPIPGKSQQLWCGTAQRKIVIRHFALFTIIPLQKINKITKF